MSRRPPGSVRDAIIEFLTENGPSHLSEIVPGVEASIGSVSQSSVRSYLNLNTPKTFKRVGRGRYALRTSK